MSKKMLIDASHPEETRVVVVNGTRVEELDFESRNKRQIRGNVYLARVTRVEPSLQAAFVEYGGNRHGFLAFSEIHPDYYQIPFEDRAKLLEAEEADNMAEAEDEEKAVAKKSRGGRRKTAPKDEDSHDDEDDNEDHDHDHDHDDEDEDEHEELDPNLDASDEDVADEADAEIAGEQNKVAVKRRKRISRRRYKIQEVIKRGQIMLIQAVKEERGNKGAALTSYLSLAGRYCVLMPNTPRGGGISRKISNGADRKHLKAIVNDLDVPPGIGVIVRTAGSKKTKADIKRDYDYLTRLWEDIKDTTMKSNAPALIHEEGNLVKRSIRDLYNKDIEEILVEGEDAYKSAKAFIKMLMPSHSKNVKQYKDNVPLYLRYEVEKQIENSLQSIVQLKSGGYLVIHPTEALVSVDVNSGRSTKERNVERTALKTNLEAAEEVARQMRLRDLAGLIVIDFIDMDENRNNRAVEKKMKDMLTEDRARVQMGRISQFGLMEISRQRRRRSLLEGSTASCEHCDGVGRKRTIESSALAAIRAVEEIGARGQAKRVKLKVSPDVALYIFNEKRDLLTHVDEEFNLFTELSGDDNLIRPSYTIEIVEKSGQKTDPLDEIEKENRKLDHEARTKPKSRPEPKDEDEDEADDEDTHQSSSKNSSSRSNTESAERPETDEDGSRKRRRRRGRRGGRNKKRDDEGASSENDTASVTAKAPKAEEAATDSSKTDSKKPSRNSGRKRKAPAKSAESVNDTLGSAEVAPSETASKVDAGATAPVLTRSKGVRKAPGRKPVAENIVEDDTATKKPATRKKAEPKTKVSKVKAKASTARTRPAPSKKETDAAPAEAKRVRKAPVKAEPEAKVTKTKAKSKAPSRKAAPSRATKVEDETRAKVATTKSKVAPKAATTKKAPARKKAPVKPKAPTVSKTVAADAQAKPKTRKAPVKKTAAKPKPEPKPQPVATAEAPIKAATITAAAPKTPDDDGKKGKKKGGWLSRILK